MKVKEELFHPGYSEAKQFKYYDIYLVLYCALIVGCSLMGLKFTPVHLPFFNYSFEVGSAIYIFPTIFIIDDIVTEVYGYAAARKMMWFGVLSFTVISILLMTAMLYPDDHLKKINISYSDLFQYIPRIFFGYVVGIFVGSIANDYILAKLKVKWEGKWFPIRAILSSGVGELALQITGTTIAFWGRLHFIDGIIPIIIFAYLYKLVFDGVSCVISYPLQKITKKAEGIDIYDTKTNFNPFKF